MTVYSGILSGFGWSLAVIGPIVPGCFFRVWVTVWVSPHPGGEEQRGTAGISFITNKNQPDLERSELIFCWISPTALAGKGFEPHDLRVMRC